MDHLFLSISTTHNITVNSTFTSGIAFNSTDTEPTYFQVSPGLFALLLRNCPHLPWRQSSARKPGGSLAIGGMLQWHGCTSNPFVWHSLSQPAKHRATICCCLSTI